jgi:hypothetical protein
MSAVGRAHNSTSGCSREDVSRTMRLCRWTLMTGEIQSPLASAPGPRRAMTAATCSRRPAVKFHPRMCSATPGCAATPTEEGTPQRGVISPLLLNVALHGLETGGELFALDHAGLQPRGDPVPRGEGAECIEGPAVGRFPRGVVRLRPGQAVRRAHRQPGRAERPARPPQRGGRGHAARRWLVVCPAPRPGGHLRGSASSGSTSTVRTTWGSRPLSSVTSRSPRGSS